MTRFSLILSALAFGLFWVADASAQCALRSGGGGGVQSAGFSGGSQSSGFQSSGQRGFQGGSQGGQLLTGPGSYFHDMMVQSRARQQYARQQAMVAAVKQAKRNTRKQAQLETRKKQRAAELARREEKKRQAKIMAQLRSPASNQQTSLKVVALQRSIVAK